jgi:hypothetical protein
MAKFYDTLTERWYEMPAAPAIERAKPPTVAEERAAASSSEIRIAEHARVWQAIEATATATQMSTEIEDG